MPFHRPFSFACLPGVALVFLGALVANARAADDCLRLVQYRDTVLVADLDRAFKHIDAAQRSLELLQPLEAEVSAQQRTGPKVAKVHQLVLGLKTAADAIGGILKLNPATGQLLDAAEHGGGFVKVVFKSSEGVGLASALADQKTAQYLLWEAVGDSTPVGAAIKASHELAENLQAHKEAAEDAERTLESVSESLKSLRQQLRRVDVRLQDAGRRMELTNKLKNEIDRRCAK